MSGYEQRIMVELYEILIAYCPDMKSTDGQSSLVHIACELHGLDAQTEKRFLKLLFDSGAELN